MTAPTRTASGAARNGQSERERTEERTRERADPRVRPRSAAAERAYARKQERGHRSTGPMTDRRTRKGGQVAALRPEPRRTRLLTGSGAATQLHRPIATAKRLQEKVTAARAPFVITVMAVLAAGIITTLWLSIAAVSNSYELRKAEAEVNALSERKETLLGQVSRMNSTPALQKRAEQLGLVPGPDPAYLVKHRDGSVTVVGEPEAAKAPEPPEPARPAPPREPGAAPAAGNGQPPRRAPEAGGGTAPPRADQQSGTPRGEQDAADVRASGRR